MSKILYGSQTYPWQMNVEKFGGQVPHMVKVLKEAGFTGIETEIVMLGDYYLDWQKLKDVLDREGIVLAALAVHEDWLHELPVLHDHLQRIDPAVGHVPYVGGIADPGFEEPVEHDVVVACIAEDGILSGVWMEDRNDPALPGALCDVAQAV